MFKKLKQNKPALVLITCAFLICAAGIVDYAWPVLYYIKYPAEPGPPAAHPPITSAEITALHMKYTKYELNVIYLRLRSEVGLAHISATRHTGFYPWEYNLCFAESQKRRFQSISTDTFLTIRQLRLIWEEGERENWYGHATAIPEEYMPYDPHDKTIDPYIKYLRKENSKKSVVKPASKEH